MKNLRKDLDKLISDVETYIVEKGQNQFINPLRYRLGLLQEKYEEQMPVFSSRETRKLEEDLTYVNAILN